MPELAVTDGMPPPDDLPGGEFRATSLPDGAIRIDRADPRILISDVVLRDAFAGHMPGVSVRFADLIPIESIYLGATLRIEGTNRTVIYRITGYVPRVRGFIGEWPD